MGDCHSCCTHDRQKTHDHRPSASHHRKRTSTPRDSHPSPCRHPEGSVSTRPSMQSHEAQRPSGPRATMGVLHHASAYASTPVTATAVTQQQPSPTRHRHTHAHAHTVSRMSHADHALVTHIAPAFPGASSCVLRGHSITQRRYTHPPAGV